MAALTIIGAAPPSAGGGLTEQQAADLQTVKDGVANVENNLQGVYGALIGDEGSVGAQVYNINMFGAKTADTLTTNNLVGALGNQVTGVSTQVANVANSLVNIGNNAQTTNTIVGNIQQTVSNIYNTPRAPTGSVLVMPASVATPTGHTTIGYPNLGFALGNSMVYTMDVPYSLNTSSRGQVGPQNNTIYSATNPRYVYVASHASAVASTTPPSLYILDTETGVVTTTFAVFPITTAAYPCQQGVVSCTGNGYYAIGIPATSYTTPASGAITFADANTGTWTIKPVGPTQLAGIVESVLISGVEHLLYIGGYNTTSFNLNGFALPTQARVSAVGSKVRLYNCTTGVITDLADLPFALGSASYRKVGNTIVGTNNTSASWYHSSQSAWNNGNTMVFKLVFSADYSTYTVSWIKSTSTTYQQCLAIEKADTETLVFKLSATAGFIDCFNVNFSNATSIDTPTQLIEMPNQLRSVSPAIFTSYTANMSVYGLSSTGPTMLKSFQAPTLNISTTSTVRPLVLPLTLSAMAGSATPSRQLGLSVIAVPASVSQNPWSVDSNGVPVAFKLVVKN